MARNQLLSQLLLRPLSKIYGLVVWVRNLLFDRGWFLKSVTPDIPTVVVGNLAVGGTGKTPHAEYIVRLMRDDYHLGVLSRGYKRNTTGFVVATRRSVPDELGDEPYQIYSKFGSEAMVAVCEKRLEGIAKMREIDPKLDLIILDDAFQHRYVKPKVAVVLVDYSRPPYTDNILPYGRLREPVSQLARADIVVVTKCPPNMSPLDFRIFKEHLDLLPWQSLFFSRFVYGHLLSVFPECAEYIPFLDWLTEEDSLLVVTGIANPRPFIRHLRRYRAKVRVLCFPDHHNFTHDDIETIRKKYVNMSGEHKYVITTEKDAVRLSHNPYYPPSLQDVTFYLPVSVEFFPAPGEQTGFDECLKSLIAKKPMP